MAGRCRPTAGTTRRWRSPTPGYRAIAYDRRGFGRSSQPWTGYDYDTLADDLAAVIDAYRRARTRRWSASRWAAAKSRATCRGMAARACDRPLLVGSILPFRLKTADNPTGTEQSAFDKTAPAIDEDRAKFFTGFFKKFFGVGSRRRSRSATNCSTGRAASRCRPA